MPAIEIRKALDRKFWKQACKITAVRHPYEKAVSKAFFHYREKKHGLFEDHFDLTGSFCPKRFDRNKLGKELRDAKEKVQCRADRDAASTD